MPYLIDGHNLIAALPDIDLADENDEAKLVIKLRGFAVRQKTKCTVIFDHGLPGGASKLSTSSVNVIFAAAHHADADALIKARINKLRDARNWTLVSSDREIRAYARDKGMRQLSAVDFAKRLNAGAGGTAKPHDGEKPTPSDEDTALWLTQFGEA